jgi:hypothetical protein
MPSGEPIWWGEMVVERERRYLDLLGLPMRERVGLARLASHLAVDGSVRVRWVGERLLLNRRP